MPQALPTLSIICSVYNEEQIVPLFFDRVARVALQLRDRFQTCVFFVDNGSSDGSYGAIQQLESEYVERYVFVLSRNFGYQAAITCGLRNSPGDLFIVIDVDCEDPPEMIVDLIALHEKGFDIAYGERLDRPEHAALKAARKFFYRALGKVADDYFILDMAEFCLITREVRDAVIDEVNSFPFIRSSIARVGFSRAGMPYRRHARVGGRSHYNLWGMFVFAVAGILTASTFPLRVPAYAFPFWIALLIILAFIQAVARPSWGLPALLVLGFGFCGYTATMVAVYAARIYKNALQRPGVVVRWSKSILPPALSCCADAPYPGVKQ